MSLWDYLSVDNHVYSNKIVIKHTDYQELDSYIDHYFNNVQREMEDTRRETRQDNGT